MIICYKCSKTIEEPEVPVHGLHHKCFAEWFNLDSENPIDFKDIILRKEDNENKDLESINASFFHGKFRKYSATLNGKNYIFKVKEEDYPELPEMEFVCNQIACELKIEVPSFYLINFNNENVSFVVENLMNDAKISDLNHIYRFIKKGQEFSCEILLKIIKDKVGHLGALKQFVFLCLFDSLIGNNDRHGRNIALINTKKGYRLAPFYDNPSYIGIEEKGFLGAELNPQGKIATSLEENPTMKDYVKEFIRLGYKQWVQEFQKSIDQEKIFQIVKNSFLSDKRQKAFLVLMERRLKELNNAL